MALDPLTRLLMVAEWLDAAAEYQDRPGALAECEANAEALRDIHAELAAELKLRGQIMREQGSELRDAEREAYEHWCVEQSR